MPLLESMNPFYDLQEETVCFTNKLEPAVVQSWDLSACQVDREVM